MGVRQNGNCRMDSLRKAVYNERPLRRMDTWRKLQLS